MAQFQSRRRFAGVAVAGITSMMVLAACGGGGEATTSKGQSGPAVAGQVDKDAFSGVPLTFVSYGGMFQEGQESAAAIPFGKESGAEILSDGPTLPAKLKAMVDAGNVTWDVVDTGASEATKNCGTMFMKLDYSKIDVSKTPEGSYGECYVPAMRMAEMLMYNPKKFDEAPQGWADYFDTKKFPGKRGMVGTPGAMFGPIIAALLADGVAPDELYPLDLDRAFAKLDTVKKDMVFWKTGAELQQFIESGEVAMAYAWSGRGKESELNGADVAPVWDQAIHVGDVLSIPKGVKNPDAAHALINYYLGKTQQEKLTEATSYSPVNVESKPKVDELVGKWLTTQPEKLKVGIEVDYAQIDKQYEEILDGWTNWMAE